MTTRIIGAMSAFALLITVAASSQTTTPKVPPPCAKGFLYDDEADACLPVVDLRGEIPRLGRGGRRPPNLATLRSRHHGTKTPAFIRPRMPVPAGGIGAGTIFNIGALPASDDTYLQTFMGIYPGGLGNQSNWIFTTSTNRTEKGTEALAAYLGATADFDIFDWSCSAADPCPLAPNPTSPGYVVVIPLANLDDGCHFTDVEDAGGHWRTTLRYRNETTVSGNWNENWVYLKNYCSNTWEGVYAHGYSGAQADCSLGQSCGWWGPIIETFGDTPSSVPELTFINARLYTGGVLYWLTDEYTNWTPPTDPWTTFDRIPNHTWGVGGRLP